MPAQAAEHEHRLRQLFAAVIAVLLAVIYLRVSQLNGRLAADLAYDDVSYANDAANRLLIGSEHGLFAFLATFAADPPHSPFSTLLAVCAFAIGGLSEFAMYSSNALVLLGVATFVTYELKNAGRSVLLLALCIVLLSPLAYRTIHDFRPDIALGFATAVMTWWFVGGLILGERVLFRRAGFALGACLLIKPTFFAHTMAIALSLVGLALAIQFFGRNERILRGKLVATGLAWFLGLGFLVSASYFAIHGSQIFSYFWDNTRGGQSGIWSFSRDLSIHDLLTIFLRDFTFRRLLGYHFIFAVVALVICGVLLLRNDAKEDAVRVGSMITMAFVSLVVIVIGRHKNELFTASFAWILLLAAVFAMAALSQRLKCTGKLWLLASATAALVLTIWFNGTLESIFTPPKSTRGTSWNQKLIGLIREYESQHVGPRSATESPTVFLPFEGPVNANTLKWLAIKQGFPINASSQLSADFVLAKSSAENSSYVVLPNTASAEYYHWLPNDSIQSDMLAWVVANPRFKPITAPTQNSQYFVFANVPLLDANRSTVMVDGIFTLQGFLEEEGPYPKWALPRVRWMNKNPAMLCMLDSPRVAHRIDMRVLAYTAASLDVSDHDGEKLASVTLSPGQFSDVSITYTPKAGKYCLTLAAQIPHAADPERLLLFSKIEISAR
ncbi:hypothetical protein [Variovorax sp. dw_308]|uniref:hypothetical protein n=1 Tax=Variovorax sp. dw_308 TaxID=2721546 RepID=UPI001C473945|nr:hypothetical protein [Variovorax sp. dw_308]